MPRKPNRDPVGDVAKGHTRPFALHHAQGSGHHAAPEEVHGPPCELKAHPTERHAQKLDDDDAYDDLKRQHADLTQLHRDLEEEIKQRRHAEELLQVALKEWQDTFDAAQDAICILSPDHRFLRCNRAMAKLAGASPESLVGRQCHEVLQCVPSPGEACFLARLQDSQRRETTVIRNAGRWFIATADPVLDKTGKITAIVHVLTDITARQTAEEAQRDLAAQRVLGLASDRLRSLGEMATNIAHELNQPLVGVRGLAEHLLIAIEKGWGTSQEKFREKLALIVEQADRMSHVIEQVRMFAREAGKPDVRPVDVNDVVRTAVSMVGAHFRVHGIVLACELAEAAPPVSANPYSLEEVLVNLMTNARDALLEKMQTHGGAAPPPPIVLRTLANNGPGHPRAEIQVIDRGAGIPEGILAKVFDPFFTTKGPNQGTGIGLAICKQIVEQFGGTIGIASKIGFGTTVTVSLPAGTQERKEDRDGQRTSAAHLARGR